MEITGYPSAIIVVRIRGLGPQPLFCPHQEQKDVCQSTPILNSRAGLGGNVGFFP